MISPESCIPAYELFMSTLTDAQKKPIFRFREDYLVAERANFERRILDAAGLEKLKETVFGGSTDLVIGFCCKELRMGRRYYHRFTSGAAIYQALTRRVAQGHLTEQQIPLDFQKLDILGQIRLAKSIHSAPDIGRIVTFLQTHDANLMDREELREAVQKFIGAPAKETKQLAFVFYDDMPTPARLMEGLKDAAAKGKIHFDTEVQYLTAHMRRLAAVIHTAPKESLAALRKDLEEDLDQLTKFIITH